MTNRFYKKIVMPLSLKNGHVIQDNLLLIVRNNRFQVCTIKEPLSPLEKRVLNQNLECGLVLADAKLDRGAECIFHKGGEVFFHDFYFSFKEDEQVSCYYLM